jgi:hypothetical protein
MNGFTKSNLLHGLIILGLTIGLAACGQQQDTPPVEAEPAKSDAVTLSDAEVENIVRRTYQFVAMYNVNNKGAFDPTNPMNTGALNVMKANTNLTDHTLQAIARPNNDTLYTFGLLDLRNEPVILDIPAFDSKYVSLMVTGYDHYVNIPMSTRLGDFGEPSRILFYTQRTKGYAGEPVEGVDKIVEMSGDFVSAVFRVMPHANEPERMQRNLEAKKAVRAITLSEFQTGVAPEPAALPDFPDFGATDFDIYENNLLEVMQFVVNHTTFEPDDEVDVELLAALAPLGVLPGRQFDPTSVAQIDGARFRAVAERIAPETLAKATDPKFLAANVTRLFQPKGQIPMELLLFQSILGPIGQPAAEAVYPAIATADGEPMNAMYDYVIRMSAEELPPATAFWSATLYDTANGFFMPNDTKKYSVGENAGMALDEEGGIAIYIAAEQPDGVPDENWLPLVRGDYGIDIIMRVYAPDLEKFANWSPPVAERLE